VRHQRFAGAHRRQVQTRLTHRPRRRIRGALARASRALRRAAAARLTRPMPLPPGERGDEHHSDYQQRPAQAPTIMPWTPGALTPAASRTASSTSTVTRRDTPGSFMVTPDQLRGELHGALVVGDEHELPRVRTSRARYRRTARRCAHRAAHRPRRADRRVPDEIENGEHQRHCGERLLAAGQQWMVLFFLPGGRAMTATPAVSLSSPTSSRYACPPPNRRGNLSRRPALMRSKVSWKRVRVSLSDAPHGLIERVKRRREVGKLAVEILLALRCSLSSSMAARLT